MPYPAANQPSPTAGFRTALVAFIRNEAQPPDKFSHQARLHALACALGTENPHDPEVLFAAVWLHDLGVFLGHRPEDPADLARWDNVAYAVKQAPGILRRLDFPGARIEDVLIAIEDHLPSRNPRTVEGTLLRDADILEQLGAVGILRTVSKVGRDTRFLRFDDALKVLQRNADVLPGLLQTEAARRLAGPRVSALLAFLKAAEEEAGVVAW